MTSKLELPRGWQIAPLGMLTASVVDQSGPTGSGDFTYIDISSVDNQSKRIVAPKRIPSDQAPSRARQNVREGDVLVSMTRPNLNGVAIVPRDLDGAVASTGFHVLRPILIEPWWVFAITRSGAFVKQMSQLVQGALYPAVRPADIRGFLVPLPPIAEQRRILRRVAEFRSRSEMARREIEPAVALVDDLRRSLLAAVFRGDLIADPLAVHLDGGKWEILSAIQQTGKLRNTLPDGWQWVTLDDLCWDAGYGTSVKCAYDGEGPAVLRIPNVHPGRLSTVDLKYAINAGAVSDELRIAAGDLLLVRTNGSRSLIGRAAVVQEAFDEPHLFASYLIRLRLTGTGALWAWVQLMMQAPQMRRVLEQKAASSAGQFNLSLSKILPMRLPLPPSEDLPHLVARLETMLAITSSVGRAIDGQLGSISDMEDAILSKALRGELVAQDPDDEPASALLERICAEKAREGEARPRRGRRSARA